MTDHVDPSKSSRGNAFMVAQAIRHFGVVGDGWIAETDTAYAADHADSNIDQTAVPLNAFDHAATSGFDVTIDTGEAFVGGSWLARDVQTTVTLASSTAGQVVYVGWDAEGGDAVIIGLSGAFTAKDPRIPIWEFDTDGTTVTASTDHRVIGHTADLSGGADIGDGSVMGRWLSDAVAADAVGTPGNMSGEAFRLAGSTSDFVTAVQGGAGRVVYAWNAYFDGTDWRFIVGGEQAQLVRWNNGVELKASTNHGTAADGDIVTWSTYGFDDAGATAEGNTFYDLANAEVPQARLGGPAASLSGYPIPAGDIADGDGSGLDADTVDGQEPSQLGGDFAELAVVTDSDTATPLEFDSDAEFTALPDYNRYRLQIYREDHGDGTEHYAKLRLNSDGSNVYDYDYYDSFNNTFESGGMDSKWDFIAGVRGEVTSGVYETAVVTQVVELARPDVVMAPAENVYPTISTPVIGAGKNTDYIHQGHFKVDSADINRIHLFGGQNSTGRVRLLGTNEPV